MKRPWALLQDLASRLAIPGLPDWTGLVALLPAAAGGAGLSADAVQRLRAERAARSRSKLNSTSCRPKSVAFRCSCRERARRAVADDWVELPARAPRAAEEDPRISPPVPPPAAWPEGRGGRPEPRLDWPGERGR
ncbi:hypothetical protein [Dankookia sp. P2]|uniref:hypothetical protein n=1 Tax=Dankookia sp. P2 TaxID=3423955 RepID=UPI003D67019D